MAFTWDPGFEKGIQPMDDTHKEFVLLVDALLQIKPDDEFIGKLTELLQHTREHFEQENRWMVACQFPPIEIHKGEHERVIQLLEQSLQQARNGNIAPARALANHLPTWFEQHTATMDNMLSVFMKNAGING